METTTTEETTDYADLHPCGPELVETDDGRRYYRHHLPNGKVICSDAPTEAEQTAINKLVRLQLIYWDYCCAAEDTGQDALSMEDYMSAMLAVHTPVGDPMAKPKEVR